MTKVRNSLRHAWASNDRVVRPRMRLGAEKLLRSPFVLMPAWIGGACVLYLLGWSDLLGQMRLDTALFLGIIGIAFFLLARRHTVEVRHTKSLRLDVATVALITVYFVGAFVRNDGVPIIQLLTGDEYDVYGFGIDGLHIAMLCLTGYYGVRAFRVFLDTGRVRDLGVLIWVVVLLGSVANRSAVSFLVFACLIVFLQVRGVTGTWVVGLILGGLIFAYLFGLFGDIRLAHQIEAATGEPAADQAVLRFSRASDAFVATGLSSSWLWAYTYFVTPLANLNAAFLYADDRVCSSACDVWSVGLYDLMPDVIGARLGAWLGVEDFDKDHFLIAPDVTASTLFGSSVGAAGAVGGFAVAAMMALIAVVSLRVLRGSPVYFEGIALLSTVIFFAFFENMIAYTSLFGQLVIVLARSSWPRFDAGGVRDFSELTSTDQRSLYAR